MKNEAMQLVIDIGNTVAKLAAFEGDRLLEVVYDDNHALSRLPAWAAGYAFSRAIVSSVVTLPAEAEARIAALGLPVVRLSHRTPLPIEVLYETPETLGCDRLAAVVGAQAQAPGRDLLVVDAGTCITYELLDAKGRYLGGNISPGIGMRLKALHAFTDKLPRVEADGRLPELGKDTQTAIRCGVMQGVEHELNGYIVSLRHKYPQLLVFLTGGDEIPFDTNLKSIIFADKFLVLKGLNRILSYNNDEI